MIRSKALVLTVITTLLLSSVPVQATMSKDDVETYGYATLDDLYQENAKIWFSSKNGSYKETFSTEEDIYVNVSFDKEEIYQQSYVSKDNTLYDYNTFTNSTEQYLCNLKEEGNITAYASPSYEGYDFGEISASATISKDTPIQTSISGKTNTKSSSSLLSVSSGDEITFSCSFDNATSYQWYYATSKSSSGGNAISGASSNTFTITSKNVTTNMSGRYYFCIAKNDKIGTRSDYIQVVVDGAYVTPNPTTTDKPIPTLTPTETQNPSDVTSESGVESTETPITPTDEPIETDKPTETDKPLHTVNPSNDNISALPTNTPTVDTTSNTTSNTTSKSNTTNSTTTSVTNTTTTSSVENLIAEDISLKATLNIKKCKVSFKWNKIVGAKNYEITDSNGKVVYKGQKTSAKNVAKVKIDNKKHKFCIVAYTDKDEVIGKGSAKVKATYSPILKTFKVKKKSGYYKIVFNYSDAKTVEIYANGKKIGTVSGARPYAKVTTPSGFKGYFQIKAFNYIKGKKYYCKKSKKIRV